MRGQRQAPTAPEIDGCRLRAPLWKAYALLALAARCDVHRISVALPLASYLTWRLPDFAHDKVVYMWGLLVLERCSNPLYLCSIVSLRVSDEQRDAVVVATTSHRYLSDVYRRLYTVATPLNHMDLSWPLFELFMIG